MTKKAICILRLSAIGDVCYTVAAVQMIQRQYPDAQIVWIIGSIEAQLVLDLPGIDFITIDKKQNWYTTLLNVRSKLKNYYFDYLLHMHPSLRANLISLFIKARVKIGFDKARTREWQSLFVNDYIPPSQKYHVLDGFLDFVRKLKIRIDDVSWQIPVSDEDQRWAMSQIANHPKVLLINPSASKTERNWPASKYAEFIKYAYQKGFFVILTGSPKKQECDFSKEIEALAQVPIRNIVGKTTLKQLLALLSVVDVVLGPDTGPVHMAVVVGTPVIGLYAHSNPQRTGPYSYIEYVVEVYHSIILKKYAKPASQLPWRTRAKGKHLTSKIKVSDVNRMFDQLIETEF